MKIQNQGFDHVEFVVNPGHPVLVRQQAIHRAPRRQPHAHDVDVVNVGGVVLGHVRPVGR